MEDFIEKLKSNNYQNENNVNNNNINNNNADKSNSFYESNVSESNISISPADTNSFDDLDSELKALLAENNARIKVVGCGGGGNNTINRIAEVGVKGVETIAVNTDAQDLLYTSADKKILIGKSLTKGMGAGSNPELGKEAAKESSKMIHEALEGADMVFVTAGLGGGTGTGSAPVVAEIAKQKGILTVAIVTMPFTMEGKKRFENAVQGLERLEAVVDTLIVIPNDKLLDLAPDLPLHTAFKLADEILTNAVKGIAELITREGLINLDFADIKAVMGNGGTALIGLGESKSENRAREAIDKAINNPLIDADIRGASGALINVLGGPDMTLAEAKLVLEEVSSKLSEDAKIIWGASINKDLDKQLKVMIIVTGVRSLQILGNKPKLPLNDENLKDAIKNNFGIDFLE